MGGLRLKQVFLGLLLGGLCACEQDVQIQKTFLSWGYSPNPAIFLVGARAQVAHSLQAKETEYFITPTLPDGLRLDSKTGEVSGIPTVRTANQTYVVSAVNQAGSNYTRLQIEVVEPTDGVCGSANGAQLNSISGQDFCAQGDPTVVLGSDSLSWSCVGKYGGGTVGCQAVLKLEGICGPAVGVATKDTPLSLLLCTLGLGSSVSAVGGNYLWSCSGKNGGNVKSCMAPRIVSGACGLAQNVPSASAPVSGLCAAGTESIVSSAAGLFKWTCQGANGGISISCSAPVQTTGICGTASGVAIASAPLSTPAGNLCLKGSSTAVSANSSDFAWQCLGSNGGADVSCNAPIIVAGSCGSANGTVVSSVPSSGLCAAGTLDGAVSSSSAGFAWTCKGSTGSASCSALLPVLSGLVKNNATNAAVAGANVVITNLAGTVVSNLTSDAAGAFSVSLPGGVNYLLSLSATGFRTRSGLSSNLPANQNLLSTYYLQVPWPKLKQLSMSNNHACGIALDDSLKCWGGSAGIGQGSSVFAVGYPADVDAGTKYSRVSAGCNRTCAITLAGVVKCWGFNGDGALADGTYTDKYLPQVTDAGFSYSEIDATGCQSSQPLTCGITTSNDLRCWGNSRPPSFVDAAEKISKMKVNGSDCAVLTTAGQIKYYSGCVAINKVAASSEVFSDFSVIGSLGQNFCAINPTGVLKCWGSNANGSTGIPNFDASGYPHDVLTPTVVDSGIGYSDIHLGPASWGITAAGVLKGWGTNSVYAVGDGTTVNRFAPVSIDPGTSYSKIAKGATGFIGCALTVSNVAKCWGYPSVTGTVFGYSSNVVTATPQEF